MAWCSVEKHKDKCIFSFTLQYTLLTELREVVLPEDRARFDELVYRREAEGQRCREFRDMLDQRHGHSVSRVSGEPVSKLQFL